MASVSALLPQAGTSIDASGELRQIASGHVDAIESAPLIVGFSNSGAADVATNQYGAREDSPSFGWVFGPKVTVDTAKNQLALTQTLVDQPVTADISVPGWWRTLRLHVQTAWAANFDQAILAHGNGTATKDGPEPSKNKASDYIVDVPLQVNPASFEQLSEYIANATWGLQYKLPVIQAVEPASIPACTDMTVLVTGPDLWRGRQAYINGIPAQSIKVMPDMQGLEAHFDLSKLKPGKATLTVWTQLGQAHSTIAVAAAGTCAAKQDATGPVITVQGIKQVVPGEKFVVQLDKKVPAGQNYHLVLHFADRKDLALIGQIDKTVGENNTFIFDLPGRTDFITALGVPTHNPGDPNGLPIRCCRMTGRRCRSTSGRAILTIRVSWRPSPAFISIRPASRPSCWS